MIMFVVKRFPSLFVAGAIHHSLGIKPRKVIFILMRQVSKHKFVALQGPTVPRLDNDKG